MTLPELALETGGAAVTVDLVRSEDGAPPRQATRVTLADDGERLRVRFDCDDEEPWATLRERDAPLWQEEVVELFVAPGVATPRRYVELEVNPLGALFDALVDSPTGERSGMRVDAAFALDGIVWSAAIGRARRSWSAELELSWRALDPRGTAREFRLNLYRIDRPRAAPAAPVEFSAWSPTLVTPADFHRPARFGILRRLG